MDPKWQKWIQCLDCITSLRSTLPQAWDKAARRWVATQLQFFHAETLTVVFQYPRPLIITTINHPTSQDLWSVTSVYVLRLEELEESVNGSSNLSSSMMACTLNDRVKDDRITPSLRFLNLRLYMFIWRVWWHLSPSICHLSEGPIYIYI